MVGVVYTVEIVIVVYLGDGHGDIVDVQTIEQSVVGGVDVGVDAGRLDDAGRGWALRRRSRRRRRHASGIRILLLPLLLR